MKNTTTTMILGAFLTASAGCSGPYDHSSGGSKVQGGKVEAQDEPDTETDTLGSGGGESGYGSGGGESGYGSEPAMLGEYLSCLDTNLAAYGLSLDTAVETRTDGVFEISYVSNGMKGSLNSAFATVTLSGENCGTVDQSSHVTPVGVNGSEAMAKFYTCSEGLCP